MEPREGFSNPGAPAGGPQSELAEKARGVAGQARQLTSRLAGRARDQADQAVSRRKEDAAGRLDTISGALQESASRLGSEEDVLARYAHSAAEGVDRVARYLRESDPEALVRDVESFARRRPEVFVGGSFVAGLVLARFLKSSSAPRSSGERLQGGEYASTGVAGGSMSTQDVGAPLTGEPDYPPAGGTRGTPGAGPGTIGG